MKKDSSKPLNVSLIWNPENFSQWNSIQYIKELIDKFGSLISVNIFYAVNSEEARRQLLISRYGQSVLFLYTQGRILIPSLSWEDSSGFAGISPEEIDSDIRAGKGKDMFVDQHIPGKLLKTYNEKKHPVLMISENSFQGESGLKGWAYFINSFLPDDQKMSFPEKIKRSENTKSEKIELTVIEDEQFFSGRMGKYVIPMLKNYGIDLEIKRVNPKEKTGKIYIKKLKIEKLPAYIFDRSIKKHPGFERLKKFKMIFPIKGYYLLNESSVNFLFIDRERIPRNLKLFIMTQCPFGIAAETSILDGLMTGAVPSDVSVNIHYIVYKTTIASVPFVSLHGNAEWEEAARQKIIQEYFPDRFARYLSIRNVTPDSSLWYIAAEEAGIDPDFIRENFDEGIEYLMADAELGEELGISKSPTFLWENHELLIGIGSLAKIEGFEGIKIIKEGSCGGSR